MEPSTSELVAGAAQGDQPSWDTLVARYSGLVWAVARSHRLSSADAADVFQTTWLRLVEHLHRIREPEHLGGWLSATARHESLRLLRISGREQPDEDVSLGRESGPGSGADGGPSPEAVVIAGEERARVVAAFEHLAPRCRLLLRMLASDPAPSYAEISQALDMPVGSIGPTRGRCLEHLRRVLEAGRTPSTAAP